MRCDLGGSPNDGEGTKLWASSNRGLTYVPNPQRVRLDDSIVVIDLTYDDAINVIHLPIGKAQAIANRMYNWPRLGTTICYLSTHFSKGKDNDN